MEPRHLPLILASARFSAPGETEPLDRLRMQKGVFLLEQKGPDVWRSLYEYRPYNWGPYSPELSNDVSRLLAQDLLEKETWPHRRYSAYRTTLFGEAEISSVVADLPPSHARFVRDVRQFVTTRTFNQLLRDVYGEFPQYAVASHFRP